MISLERTADTDLAFEFDSEIGDPARHSSASHCATHTRRPQKRREGRVVLPEHCSQSHRRPPRLPQLPNHHLIQHRDPLRSAWAAIAPRINQGIARPTSARLFAGCGRRLKRAANRGGPCVELHQSEHGVVVGEVRRTREGTGLGVQVFSYSASTAGVFRLPHARSLARKLNRETPHQNSLADPRTAWQRQRWVDVLATQQATTRPSSARRPCR